jgi:thiamine biosynthesis lipoprotein
MKRSLCAILLICTLLSCLSLYSCTSPKEKYSNHTFDYFDTVTTVTGYASSKEEFDDVFKQITDLLKEYHKLFTIYDRYEGINNLTTVNELFDGAHRPVKVDKKIIDMLLFSKEMCEKTNGKVNVAMGSVLSIWHDYREAGDDPNTAVLPPMDKLEEAAKHTDINSLIIDEEASTVFLSDPKMKLDVGAIAKGYAAEQIAQYLISKGIAEGYVLNVGGNVRAIGLRGDKTPWVAGIDDPNGTDDAPYYAIVNLEDLSLVTSGSYQRFYIVNGKSYHHIISPDTLMPATEYVSVSILCESSALADGLSTALFCMSIDEGKAVLKAIGNVEAMWVKENGDIIYTDGFKNYIQGDIK